MANQIIFRRSACVECGMSRPQQTTEMDGFRVSHSGGRPVNTTREAGYCASDGRPRGTTRVAGCNVSSGRPHGTTRDDGFATSSG